MAHNQPITPQPSSFLVKAQGYLGLLVVVLFAAFMLAPWNKAETKELSSYIFRTGAFYLLSDTDDGIFLRTLSYTSERCRLARIAASPLSLNTLDDWDRAALDVERACNIATSVMAFESVLDRIESRSPGIKRQFFALRSSTHTSESRATPEYQQGLKTVQEQFLPEGTRILEKFTVIIWAALCLSFGALSLGVLYRRKIGYFLIFPFSVVARIGKQAHEKV